MEQQVTAEYILSAFESKITNKEVVPPHWWVDAAVKLNVLIGSENDKLFTLELNIAQKRVEILKEPKTSVAKANVICEALPEYKEMQVQKARVKQIEEFIRLAKKQATLTIEEYRAN